MSPLYVYPFEPMKHSIFTQALLLAPVAVCLAQTPPPAQAPSAAPKTAPKLEDVPGNDAIVLRIGDRAISRSQFESLIAALPDQQKAQLQSPAAKRKFAEQIVQLEAMAEEARKRGLEKSEANREMIRMQSDGVLANALYRELSATVKPDDAALKTYYDQHKNEYEEVTAMHILIRFKGSPVPLRAGQTDLTDEQALAKAQDIRKKIEAGGDFAALAKAESDDTQSGQKGGDLGTFTHGRMVASFDEAAFKAPVGQVTEPIKTQFGYHIIKVTKHDTKNFDDVKAGIEQKVKPQLAQKAVEDIRKQASVTINDSYFGPAAPPATPPAPPPAAAK